MEKIDYDLTKQHFSTKIYRSYLNYIAKNYPSVNLSQLCSKAGLPSEYVFNSDGWVSLEFNSRFMSAIKEQITDPDFEYKVGQSSFSKEIMGPVYYLMRNVLSLEEIYNNIWRFPKYFNKVLDFHAINKKPGQVTIQVTANLQNLGTSEVQHVRESILDIVNNSLGYYYGFAKAKGIESTNIKAIKISELEYHIEAKYPLEHSKLLTSLIYPTAAAALPLAIGIYQGFSNFQIILGCVTAFSLAMMFLAKRQMGGLTEAANQAEETLNKLDNQYKTLVETKLSLQRRLRESEAINELTNSLIQTSSEDEILQSASDCLTSILKFDRVLIMLQDSSKSFLEVRANSLFDKKLANALSAFKLPIDIESDDRTKVSNIYRSGLPVLIEDVKTHLEKLNPESQQVLKQSGAKSFIGVPIRSSKSSLGVLLVDTFYSDRQLTKEDLDLLVLAGRQIAIALEKQKAQAEAVDAYIELGVLAKSYSRFVPFEIFELLGFKSVLDVEMEAGKELNMAIIFCDIRGFTSMSEGMTPGDAMSFLNSYFAHLAPVFNKHKGIIDKFMGDGIMALFVDAKNAFKAAAEFQISLEEYNRVHRSGGKRQFIRTGMGVHFGKVLLGAVGYQDRLSISVVSDSVNLTSRLDGLTKKFGVDILCSEEAFNKEEDFENFRLIAQLSVEGRKGLTRIYEYFGHQNESLRQIKRETRIHLINLVEGTFNFNGPEHDHLKTINDSVVTVYLKQYQEKELAS